MRERSRSPVLRRLGFPSLTSLLTLLLAVPSCRASWVPHRSTPLVLFAWLPRTWPPGRSRLPPCAIGRVASSIGSLLPRPAPPLRDDFLAWAVIDPTRGAGYSLGVRLALPCRSPVQDSWIASSLINNEQGSRKGLDEIPALFRRQL